MLDTASPSRSLPLAGDVDAFWRIPREALLASLGTGASGLSVDEAGRRLARYGPNDAPRSGCSCSAASPIR